jgi:hypothetical protein
MHQTLTRASTLLAILAICLLAIGSAGAGSAVVAPFKSCKQLNARYPLGVGKLGARDHTSGTPVTAYRRSNTLYAKAMRNNRGLDRDHDGIACEKA